MSQSKTATHNESRAEFNGTGETVDAAVTVVKPDLVGLVQENKRVLVGATIAFVGGMLLKDKLAGLVASGAYKTAEVAEEVAE